uniref:Uncharacterized protein n=1 Tax=Rhizophora mucronata TaxID=61149 RepID=A0A2P2P4L3_RHIMU
MHSDQSKHKLSVIRKQCKTVGQLFPIEIQKCKEF